MRAIGPKAALDMGNEEIIVESDCAVVISNIYGNMERHCMVIRELLQDRSNVFFKIERHGNKFAHELVKQTQISRRRAVYLGQLPLDLARLVLSYCNNPKMTF